ncbi:MAG TPA: ABC transporter ATP-binding protein [Syntrophales bacterium]|nr:ABC transporter ATP-binding protein [Syntrophales bacterium]HPQ43811.1 ABC transporter ATP-binding protein [Syntrophales bacterium]
MDENIIEIADVTYAYPERPAVLAGVDLVVKRGERVGIIGPNGSGKTTLFHLIMGLAKPQSGTITVFGRAARTEDDFFEVRRKIGFFFQNSEDQLFCPTVKEDVAFGPLNLGKNAAEAKAIVRRTLETLGILDFENRVSHKLSHGEKKMVALASVLAMDPEVLILDEPTAGLDNETKDRLMEILSGFDLTLIITSHEMNFMSSTADTFYALQDGRIHKVEQIVPHTHTHVHVGGEYSHRHEDEYA